MELAGNAGMRSGAPQDLLGLQEAHGWEGGWEVTSVSGADIRRNVAQIGTIKGRSMHKALKMMVRHLLLWSDERPKEG